ncbi:hypothetical protein N7495_009079 [Penicillium taxi]|uniref:uncharacterized protein n=1 Tax=Penicillium taxi TaxID=168475 RepID=UPI002544E780|nr:uncharacterized protein N7495_009079 [Penicillium taxi]KAJ5889038.1 hypothetical protein N7495_009079 [Penicillium taxi]
MASSKQILHFPIVSVENLQITDAERIFHLTQNHNTDWVQFQASSRIPDDCNNVISIIDDSVSTSDGKHKIALLLRLPILLASVIDSSSPESPSQHNNHSNSVPFSSKCRFFFTPIIYKGKEHCLEGIPDFSLWYSYYSRKENASVNFVIVEKELGQSSLGIPQVLAFIGMIYAQRRYENRHQHDIFGLATDNEQFHFIRVNSEGQWSLLDINYGHTQEILETLAYIHTKASILYNLEEINGSKEPRLISTTNDNVHGSSSMLKTWSVFQVEESIYDEESNEESNESDNEYDED